MEIFKMTVFLFLVVLFMSFPLLGKPLGTASFHAIGEGLAVDINGEGGAVEGDVKRAGGKVSGVFKVRLSDFKTGISLRDEHYRKLLETDKYPVATFTLLETDMKSGTIAGTLDFHGKMKPIIWPAEFTGNRARVDGKLKLTDFNIVPPEYKLAKVANEVEITIDITIP